MKEYLEKIKMHHILIIVLLIIVAVLYFDNREFKKMLYRQQFAIDSYYDNMNDFNERRHRYNYDCPRRQYFMDNYFDDIDRDINAKVLEMEREFRRLNRDFERLNNDFTKQPKDIKGPEEARKEHKRPEEPKKLEENKKLRKDVKNINNFVYNPQINKNDKTFELVMNLPKNTTRRDIKVNFINNNLTLNVNKNIKDKDLSFESTFFESYYIPDTKATNKDIKIDLKNDILKVIVPIIK